MSLFGVETNRLIRLKWQPEQIDDLAQELYALLSGQLPMFIDAPVTISPTDNSPPLTINQPGGNQSTPAVTINNGGFEQTIGGITNGDVTYGGITFNPPGTGLATPPTGTGSGSGSGGGGGGSGAGGLDLGTLDYPDGPPNPAAIPPPGQNPFNLYGEVVAKLGGNQYSVNLWARSPYTSPKLATLAVRFPGIDPDEVIPGGTPCPVICFPGPNANNNLGIAEAIGFVPFYLPSAP